MTLGLAKIVKRLIDIGVALAGFVVLSPVFAASAIAVGVSSGRPILYSQVRPGLHGRPFVIYKFRTMLTPEEGTVFYLTDNERLTSLGRFLRQYSIDELPSLWNVLKGDMSLVGPRPLLMEYLPRYKGEQARRHEMRPGLTGWAQINGRQLVPFSERLEMDLWYIDNWSLGLDMRILLKSPGYVLRSAGVIHGQDLTEIDDLGLIPGLPANRRNAKNVDD